MEKEKLISKLNIKDYNNQLEKILSKKDFSEDIKNLLLSMLYKIENAYDDYNMANVNTKTKKEILEEILKIIARDCDAIEVTKSRQSKSLVEGRKITTYLDAKKMLYEIYQISSKKYCVKNEHNIIKPALEFSLNQGYSISSSEVIRDFDGWSWNILKKEIENFNSNLIYQTLKILVGVDFLTKWQQNNAEDYVTKLIEKLQELYKTELADNLFKLINQISILNIMNDNQERERLLEIQKKLQDEYDELDNKKEYITKLGNKKKEIVEQIKNIDNMINNDRKLKNEFIVRNEVLDMNNRIFSLSDFVEILEAERLELIKQLNKYNKKMEPLNFIKTKTEIENKLQLIKELDLQNKDKKIYNIKIKELLIFVCKAINIQIDNIEEKEKITELIYKIRYYSSIYVKEDIQIKNIIDMNNIQETIITKACREKTITIFSKNIKQNYEIIKNIFQTDIIDLKKIFFKFIFKENKIVLEIYDEENIYKIVEYEQIIELNIKTNKRTKVFI